MEKTFGRVRVVENEDLSPSAANGFPCEELQKQANTATEITTLKQICVAHFSQISFGVLFFLMTLPVDALACTLWQGVAPHTSLKTFTDRR